jgi:hypothetical protein
LQLALPPFGERPLPVLRGGLLSYGERMLASFVAFDILQGGVGYEW